MAESLFNALPVTSATDDELEALDVALDVDGEAVGVWGSGAVHVTSLTSSRCLATSTYEPLTQPGSD